MPDNTVTITIDGTQLPPMKENGLTIIPHKLWGSNSGRSASTGTFVGDLVAIKYELQLTWENLNDEEFAVIDGAVNTLDPFMTVTFCPSAAEGYVTKTFYANDPQYPIKVYRGESTLYGTVTVNLIEK